MNELPHNLEAEKAVLGACLLDAQCLTAVYDLLKPHDFSEEKHRSLFGWLQGTYEAGKPTDLTNAASALGKSVGSAYLSSLVDVAAPGIASAIEHAHGVRDKSAARSVILSAQALISECFKSHSADELSALAINAMLESGVAGDSSCTRSYRKAATDLLTMLDKREAKPVFTGITELDRKTNGFLPGELILFTAETGVGKTLLAQQTRRRACRDGIHSLFVSAEMTAEHLLSREMSAQAEVPSWKLRRAEKIEPYEWEALGKQAAQECEHCRILDGAVNVGHIASSARRMKAEGKLGMVIIDYDELVSAPGERELEQQAAVAASAKRLAKDLRVVVILISQLRKLVTGEDRKRPSIQRLYGSGAKVKHASIVIYVDREYVAQMSGDETAAKFCVLKSRDGRVGSGELFFDLRSLEFRDAIRDEVNVP